MDQAALSSIECPPEHRQWVEKLLHGGSLPLCNLTTHHHRSSLQSNSWACTAGDVFSVRGPDYLQTKAKIAGGKWLLHPLAFDLLQGGPSQIAHIMAHSHCRVRAALDAATSLPSQHQPFVWAFNIQVGNKTHLSFVYYFVSFQSPPPGSLLQRFLDGDDTFRNSRIKLMIRFPEAPELVKKVVGERWPVCRVGKIVNCSYMRGKNYMEVDMDVASSIITRTTIKLTLGLGPRTVMDLAFMLEGMHENELPERILGAMRIFKPDVYSAALLDMSEGNLLHQKPMADQGVKPSRSSTPLKDSCAVFTKMGLPVNNEQVAASF